MKNITRLPALSRIRLNITYLAFSQTWISNNENVWITANRNTVLKIEEGKNKSREPRNSTKLQKFFKHIQEEQATLMSAFPNTAFHTPFLRRQKNMSVSNYTLTDFFLTKTPFILASKANFSILRTKLKSRNLT